MSDSPWILPLTLAHDVSLVGGKASNLAQLINSGLPVPSGFAITTASFHAWCDAGDNGIPEPVREAMIAAYRTLGGPQVAVRSSATAEDGKEASMAGQYETILGVEGEDALCAAVCRCWQASDSARVTHYLAKHAPGIETVSLGLVVQPMISADAAGVLFTANPRNGRRNEMLLEAAWGLGEAVVSGKVQPDVITLDHDTGHVLDASIAEKSATYDPATGEMSPLPPERRSVPVLGSADVAALARWGRRVEDIFGEPQDIEWALHRGRVYLLQSRPITTLAIAAAREETLNETRARLITALETGQGPWIVHNLGETAPRPTPLTWTVLQRFMSGQGGYGNLQRKVGFTPGPSVEREGFLDLIGGQIYMDVSRGPEMFGAGFPFHYDIEKLRADPDAANGPPTLPAGSIAALWRAGRVSRSVEHRLETYAADFDHRLESDIIPAFAAWVAEERKRDPTKLSPAEWIDLWRIREQRTMDDFASSALLPSVLCVWTTDRFRQFLETRFWDDEPDALLATLSVPVRHDSTIKSNSGLCELAEGRNSLENWLGEHGHRAPEEFELATPRWSERPEAIAGLVEHMRGREDPAMRHDQRQQAARDCLASLSRRLSSRDSATLQTLADRLSRYLPYREDGKHHLMLGYGLLRDLALEAARRLDLDAEVFLLTPAEIEHALETGYAPHHLINERRLRREAEKELALPTLLTRLEVENIGDPPPVDFTVERWKSVPLAGGRGSGPVRILNAPDQIDAGERGFVLVCATTDPGWTPLFASAEAVVVERGGSLSHGAVVAREMGVPAVTLPGATRLLREGETVTVDGRHGWVARGAPPSSASDEAGAADDEPIPRELQPPPPGDGEEQAARWRRIGFSVWGVFLAAFFLLPAPWLQYPAIQTVDLLLWPLVATWGKVATVAILAAVTATVILVGQRVLNDHARLVIAKQRWQRLQARARTLPEDAPRRKQLLACGAGVQKRLTLAAFTPLAILLGPMVLSFMWLMERIDPLAWNPSPGSSAAIVALVDGDHLEPLTIELSDSLQLAPHSSFEQQVPPVRETLEALRQRWQAAPSGDNSLPWDVRAAARRTRAELLDDLRSFLAQPVPPQTVAWTVDLPEERGRFPVVIRTSGMDPVHFNLLAGDAAPPSPPIAFTSESAPIRELSVEYREARIQDDRVFATPFSRFGWAWDVGWLGVYLLVYLPVMVVVRRALRLP